MTRLIPIALCGFLSVGCVSPMAFIIPGDGMKVPEGAKPSDKAEVHYRPPVLASQVTAQNAKEKAADLNEELDRDLMDLVESQSREKK
ncbi:MAG: hypothetical protein U0746_05625 [Gemmataceae bacterium]